MAINYRFSACAELSKKTLNNWEGAYARSFERLKIKDGHAFPRISTMVWSITWSSSANPKIKRTADWSARTSNERHRATACSADITQTYLLFCIALSRTSAHARRGPKWRETIISAHWHDCPQGLENYCIRSFLQMPARMINHFLCAQTQKFAMTTIFCKCYHFVLVRSAVILSWG